MFKGLHQDSYIVIRHVLEICWSGLWSDAKLKRTLKVAVFNETTLIQLCKIYDNRYDDDGVPADVVHHFLLAICTHPGAGVCFKETGWYPRENVEDDRPFAEEGEEEVGTKSKIYNKILNNLIRNLKPNEDPRQQELVLKILAACPELIAGSVLFETVVNLQLMSALQILGRCWPYSGASSILSMAHQHCHLRIYCFPPYTTCMLHNARHNHVSTYTTAFVHHNREHLFDVPWENLPVKRASAYVAPSRTTCHSISSRQKSCQISRCHDALPVDI